MQQVISWVEIPSTDFDRAVQFYRTMLGAEVPTEDFMGVPHGFLLDGNGERRGAVIHSPEAIPGATGPLIYVYADDELDAVLARAELAGGKVLTPVTAIGPQGSIAIVLDTEGNRVGLHRQ